MSDKIDNGGAAFPNPCGQNIHHYNDSQKGMTLRDYFAAKAMQSIIAKMPLHKHNSSSDVDAIKCNMLERDNIRSEVCRGAYLYADAMIAARGEK